MEIIKVWILIVSKIESNKKAAISSDFYYVVRHAWRLTWWWKSTMGVCSNQPLAKSKGVHREVESEGSWRQSSDPRNTNIIRRRIWDEFATQNEVQFTTQTYQCKWCGYMERKWIVLPWEVSWTWRDKFESRLKQDLSWEVSRYHSTRGSQRHRGRVEP